MKDLLRKSKVSLLSFVALGCFTITRFPEIQNALALVVTPQGTTTPETKRFNPLGTHQAQTLTVPREHYL